ncbi:hypothetical protein OG462_32665 [Streptomyces sp. NBC_01077]|uniref:hypothetical protein n=1 Tax=Streptomyces sp. NBC_01077 TaxID=2903746 RepID=UPI0038676EE7|nr:hypothetical protein OG462_32665 [Streptomyces sp. NBC_01077]
MARAVDFSFGILVGVICAAIIVEMRERKSASSLNSLRIAMFASSLMFLVLYIAGS